jgi:hypothetical protein
MALLVVIPPSWGPKRRSPGRRALYFWASVTVRPEIDGSAASGSVQVYRSVARDERWVSSAASHGGDGCRARGPIGRVEGARLPDHLYVELSKTGLSWMNLSRTFRVMRETLFRYPL